MTIAYFVESTIALIIQISLPILVTATIVGLIVSIFQALTQIQEQTLPQVAKIGAVAVLLLLMGSTGGTIFIDYMNLIFSAISRI